MKQIYALLISVIVVGIAVPCFAEENENNEAGSPAEEVMAQRIQEVIAYFNDDFKKDLKKLKGNEEAALDLLGEVEKKIAGLPLKEIHGLKRKVLVVLNVMLASRSVKIKTAVVEIFSYFEYCPDAVRLLTSQIAKRSTKGKWSSQDTDLIRQIIRTLVKIGPYDRTSIKPLKKLIADHKTPKQIKLYILEIFGEIKTVDSITALYKAITTFCPKAHTPYPKASRLKFYSQSAMDRWYEWVRTYRAPLFNALRKLTGVNEYWNGSEWGKWLKKNSRKLRLKWKTEELEAKNKLKI